MQMGDLNGCNLYAYCGNNPVMETDPEGTVIGIDDAVYTFFALFIIILFLATMPQPDFRAFDIDKSDMGGADGKITEMGKSKGGGKDSEFGQKYPNNVDGNNELEKALENARKTGDTQLAIRLIREQKNRKQRNKRKKRGGPHMRNFWWLLLMSETIRRLIDAFDD